MSKPKFIEADSAMACKVACLALIERGASFNVERAGEKYRIHSDDSEGLWLTSIHDFPTPVNPSVIDIRDAHFVGVEESA